LIWLLGAAAASHAQGSQSAGVRITQPISENNLVELKKSTHPLARPQYDRGAVADSAALEHMLLVLKRSPGQEQALAKLMGQQNDPHSSNYHKWLTAEEFGEQFGPSRQDIATVTGWLRSHGLQVNLVYPSGMMIDVSGTVGQVREAFHTGIHSYDVNGAMHVANASDPQIPAALAPVVAGFASLNDFRPWPAMRNVGAVRRDASSGKWKPVGWTPQFSFTDPSGNEQYDVGPQDFATIYNVTPLWNAGIYGKGQTIVVVEDTNMNGADWSHFRSEFGLSHYTGGSLAQVHPEPKTGKRNCLNPGLNPNEPEAALDAEWASAVAPKAKIKLASCADTNTTFGGLIAAQNLINSKTPPPIMSVSYGECESDLGSSGNSAYSTTWQQAAAEGTSVYVAAGDSGASVCNVNGAYATTGINVSGFASTPYNVAVGGTDFNDINDFSTYWNTSNGTGGGSALSYIPEIPWNDSCASGVLAGYAGYASGLDLCNDPLVGSLYIDDIAGSGGPSSVYPKCSTDPSDPNCFSETQTGGDTMRDLPDVSLFAGNGLYSHALLFCMSTRKQGGAPCNYKNADDTIANSAGGTSFAAPSFAGIQALVNEKTAQKWGNPVSKLYSLAGTSGVFNDITAGDNDVVCQVGTLNCYAASGDTYGVLSTSSTTLAVAYAAGTGWNFAAGLGSVNVANLVNSW
jgi:subtilase family serine protease